MPENNRQMAPNKMKRLSLIAYHAMTMSFGSILQGQRGQK
jgi:hypothetical protein